MGSDDSPRITVVIPVWGRYVDTRFQEAVRSIARQGVYAPIVIVDNASDVELPQLSDARVVRTSTRLTLGAARNLGLDHVKTPYVIFWDADDLMPSGTLAFMQDEIQANPALVAFGMALIEDPSGQRHRWPRPWIGTLVRLPPLFAALDSVWSVFPTTGSTVMRADGVRKAGGFTDADSGDDWCLGAALACRGRCGWSERPGRIYLQHHGSIWQTHAGWRDQLQHAAAVRTRLRQTGVAPAWLRLLLPLVAVAQWAAVAAHLLVTGRRRLLATRGVA